MLLCQAIRSILLQYSQLFRRKYSKHHNIVRRTIRIKLCRHCRRLTCPSHNRKTRAIQYISNILSPTTICHFIRMINYISLSHSTVGFLAPFQHNWWNRKNPTLPKPARNVEIRMQFGITIEAHQLFHTMLWFLAYSGCAIFVEHVRLDNSMRNIHYWFCGRGTPKWKKKRWLRW